jgi:cytoskeletal protein CcmA (bactofilin family)
MKPSPLSGDSMSIFKQPTPMPNERPISRPESSIPDGNPSTSTIATGMKLTGDVETNGVVKVEGTIEGSIKGARQVVLSRTGLIQGDIHADEVILGGRVVGTVHASERVEIQNTCRIEGDIHTRSIVVVEGGIINGGVRMEDSAPRATSLGGDGAAAIRSIASSPVS